MEPTLTEERNPLTSNIDTLPTLDMLALINAEDQKVALVVRHELANIAAAVDAITKRMQARRAADLHWRGHIRTARCAGCLRMSTHLRNGP